MTIQALMTGGRILLENSAGAKQLHTQHCYGAAHASGVTELSGLEALYLLHKEKIVLRDGKNKSLTFTDLLSKLSRNDKSTTAKFSVYAALRNKGYIVKTALKFGADFRVYDKGVKPGEDHSRWVVYAVREADKMTWYDFSAKNRVAHSTKKRLLIGVVDDEGDVTFWESAWLRP